MNRKYNMVEKTSFLKKENEKSCTHLESPGKTPEILNLMQVYNEQSNSDFLNNTFLELLNPQIFPNNLPSQKASKLEEDGWHLKFQSPEYEDASVSILYKTRKEKPTVSLPKTMYSSIKYDLIMRAKGSFLEKVQFLMAKVFVVDSTTFERLLITPSLKGTVEVALTRSTNLLEAEGKLLVQFEPGISFHKEKREFRLEMLFFAESDLQTPILVKRSTSFRVYARKPNKPKSDKKKKTEPLAPEEETGGKKRKKVSGNYKKKKKPDMKVEIQNKDLIRSTGSEFELFEKKFEGLVEMMNKLSGEEKKKAVELIYSKFGCNELIEERHSLLTPGSLSAFEFTD